MNRSRSNLFNDEYYDAIVSKVSKLSNNKAKDLLIKESLRIHEQILTTKLIEKYTPLPRLEWNYQYEYEYLEDLRDALALLKNTTNSGLADDEPNTEEEDEDETEKIKYYQYQFPQFFDWICSFFVK
jgi:hypothetical protein